jgi:hypothetical protein
LAREPEVLLVADGDHRDSFRHKPAEVVKVDHTDAIDRALGQPTQIIDRTALPPEIIFSSSNAENAAAFKPFAKALLECVGPRVVTPEYNDGVPGF